MMNKCFRYAAVGVVSALALSACSKDSVTPSSSSEGSVKTVTFTAGPVETKTIFGDKDGGKYPTLWTSNQQVAISYNLGAFQNVDVENISEDKTTASFTATIEPDQTEGATHTFYAVSPAYNVSLSEGKIKYTLPFAQWGEFANSCNEYAQLLVAKAEYDVVPSSVNLSFKHILAYGKIKVILPSNAGIVHTLKIEVKNGTGNLEKVAGSVLIDPSTLEVTPVVSSEYGDTGISVTNYNSLTSALYFAMFPIGDLSGKTLVVTVEPTAGSTNKFVKTIPISESGKLAFNAGQVSEFTVDFTK